MRPDLSERVRRALLWGGAVIALLILYLLLRGGDSTPRAEPLPADNVVVERPATYAAPVQPPVVAAPVAVALSADLSQLRLVGILSSGAVIVMANGMQRFVPVGREIVPGVTLRGVDVHHAILATPAGEVRLGFDIPAQPQDMAAPAAAPTSRVLPTP